MNMTSVSSSNLASVGYQNGVLYIRFHSGGLYSYFDVNESVYQDLLNAPSKGKFFYRNIRRAYSYQKIG